MSRRSVGGQNVSIAAESENASVATIVLRTFAALQLFPKVEALIY